MDTVARADIVVAGAPTIQTERLTLRAHSVLDFEACCAMWAHPGVTRFISGRPSSAQQTWSRLLAYAGHWSLLGFGYWALEERDSGGFIGELGFADFKREITPADLRVPELGWALAPHAHGKGYATEALRAVVAWADSERRWPRTACLIDPDNAPSLRVADRCGYREVERLEHDGRTSVLLSRSLPTAASAAGASPQSIEGACPKAAIDALIRAFFAAFSRRSGSRVSLAALRELCLPEALFINVQAGVARSSSLEQFIAPREELLNGDALTDFEEHEVSEQTQLRGAIAQRFSSYRKAWVSSSSAFEGGGVKTFQLVRTGDRFRIASLIWQDDPPR